MAIPQLITDAVNEQRILTLALDDPRIIDAAKNIAYYSAMIDAAEDDPEPFEDKDEMIADFKTALAHHLLTYMELVNEAL